MEKQKVAMVCEACGSDNVGRDAWASWDEGTQAWVLRHDSFDEAYCFECSGECSIIEKELSA